VLAILLRCRHGERRGERVDGFVWLLCEEERHQVFPDLVRRSVRHDAAKIVPATAIDTMAKAGAGFAGFAVWFDMTPAHADILVMADLDTRSSFPGSPRSRGSPAI
jgi:hypothetical protein